MGVSRQAVRQVRLVRAAGRNENRLALVLDEVPTDDARLGSQPAAQGRVNIEAGVMHWVRKLVCKPPLRSHLQAQL